MTAHADIRSRARIEKRSRSMRVHPSDSLSLQSGLIPTASLESCRGRLALVLFCKSHRETSERPTTPCVEHINHIPSANRWPGAMTSSQHVYGIRPRKDRREVDLISE